MSAKKKSDNNHNNLITEHRKKIAYIHHVYYYAKSSYAYCRNLHEGNHVPSRHLKQLRYMTFALMIVELQRLLSYSKWEQYSLLKFLDICSKDKYVAFGYDIEKLRAFKMAFEEKHDTLRFIEESRNNRYSHFNPEYPFGEIPDDIFNEINYLLELALKCLNFLSVIDENSPTFIFPPGKMDMTGFHLT